MNRAKQKLRDDGTVFVFKERDLVAQGVRWITVHAKTMLNRGARDLFALLGQMK